MDCCTSQFKIKSTRGWVNSFVVRPSDEVIQTRNCPQEEERLQIPRVFLERIIQSLHNYIQGCVADLMFNLDDVDIMDYLEM
jgi:hypothetical protein